jgi:glycosyltransferase involved in cell wall biosynthesis
MACGLPVIIGDGIGATEFVGPGSGITVAAGDVEAIAAAMDTMIGTLATYDPARIRAGIVGRFGFEVFGSRMRELYASLGGGRSVS